MILLWGYLGLYTTCDRQERGDAAASAGHPDAASAVSILILCVLERSADPSLLFSLL